MELKPCPFCGAERKLNGDLISYQGRSGEFMHRRNGCILGGFLIKDVEAWDRRVESNMVEIDQFSRVGEGEKE